MIDILFLAHGRVEFTVASLKALNAHTDWNRARLIYAAVGSGYPMEQGPVAVMNHFLSQEGDATFAKIDNDVIVPPGWLEQCLSVMDAHPELDLLGIEPPASRTRAPWKAVVPPAPELNGRHVINGNGKLGYAPCEAIGGVGLMRRRAFESKAMPPVGLYGGFTAWQYAHSEVRKGWIVPPLNLFLLDRLPVEPWASLSRQYVDAGQQRHWTRYDPKDSALWEWWL
ncbi:MAG TPA: hypothetical protein VNH18_14700 [Bryobacteraceae bacterium]|nr:hypothetical protein [Blastocatellia bacterium]HXJ40528.1 hypothetical protein [Bryobacteraceae bacterium]